jgi:hypothetical protein
VDLSHSPLLGILGVLLGAGIVTLTGRLLTLGLADLKGNVGIEFDESVESALINLNYWALWTGYKF